MKEDIPVKEDLPIDEGSIEIPCAIKKDFWNQLAGSVSTGNNNLLPVSVYKLCNRLASLHELGAQTVAIDQIKGRVGLSKESDPSLVSREKPIQYQRTSPDARNFLNPALPLIDLLKIENTYFVLSGHHWLSVASINNEDYIEAHVIEVKENIDC